MASILVRTDWTPNRLLSRIGEGEALLHELPGDSDWTPIVCNRLLELRAWLQQLETRARVA